MFAGASGAQSSAGGGSAYVPGKTPDGQPDIQGMWLPGGGRPMERPAAERGTAVSAPGTQPAGSGGAPPRKPMVVDPADGIIPLQPWAAVKRQEIMAHQEKLENLDPRVRCLPSGVPRINLPVGYNTYQFLPIPGYVVLLYAWNHIARVIPLDGRPHVAPDVRLFMGDSRGRWEGNTLIVDVTNFTNKTWAVGHGDPGDNPDAQTLNTGHGVFNSDALHVVERFTLIDANTISYQATIEDPKVFTRPWTIEFNAFLRAPKDHMLFEYACHEGNEAIPLITGTKVTK